MRGARTGGAGVRVLERAPGALAERGGRLDHHLVHHVLEHALAVLAHAVAVLLVAAVAHYVGDDAEEAAE